MKIDLQQKQIQSLNLMMTPALRQAIELLQYSTYELHDYLKEQALDNPLLELKESSELTSMTDHRQNHHQSFKSTTTTLDWIPNQETNRRDELFHQVNLIFHQKEDLQLLEYLIYNLDDDGYLRLEIEEANHPLITRGIQLLQKVGPVGIGARNLQECLLLQLSHHYPNEMQTYTLLEKHFDLLTERKWQDIAKELDISLEEVGNLRRFIQKLNPKPCAMTNDYETEYLRPDIVIEKKDQQFVCFLNDRYLPSIHINNDYLSMRHQNQEISTYINEHYSQIQWLLNSIEQRRKTISKITEVLLKKQQLFFEKGFIALQPLTLKEVADEIDMHESTVSRATANKIIQTPRGTFELRKLFTSKLATADGDAISQIKVKTLLKHFVEQEDKQKPFSDQKIANYLKEIKGITISRRTVSKYREELNILSSRMRKEI